MNINSIPLRVAGVAAAGALALGVALVIPADATPPGPGGSQATNRLLFINGTSGNDNIQFVPVSSNTSLQVTNNDQLLVDIPLNAIDRVLVELGPGDDVLNAQPIQTLAAYSMSVNGGDGNDTITTEEGDDTINGGAGNDVLSSRGGVDAVIGGIGNDTIVGGQGDDSLIGEDGNDTFTWFAGDGSDSVDGGLGTNVAGFTGTNVSTEAWTVSGFGTQTLIERNVGAVELLTQHVQAVQINGANGPESITVNDLTGTDTRNLGLDLGVNAAADHLPDAVTINGTKAADTYAEAATATGVTVGTLRESFAITGADPTDVLHFATGLGLDHVGVPADAAAKITTTVDLGPDQP